MAMQVQRFSRVTMPHGPTLAASLASLLAVANAGSFHLRYEGGQVVIEQASFAGVDLTAVGNAVASAPAWTEKLDARAEADNMPLLIKSAFLTMLDLVNAERARHAVAAVTPAQFVASVKTKVDAQ